MEKELSESIQTDIKQVINTILREIELRNIQPVSGIFPFWISSNNFNYLKDPYDLGRIIDKINKGERKRVLRVVPNEDYDNHSYSVDGGTNQITEQSIIELQKMKNISDHKYISFGIENRLSFLIEDLGRLKQIAKKPKVSTPKITNTSVNFYFNHSNGELSLYPKDMNKRLPFIVGKGRYKLMVFLIEEKNKDDNFYIPTSELTRASGYKSDQKCRESIHSIREKVGKTFKKIKGNEFIEAKQPEGYRIGKKISISFEDTP